MFRRGIGLEGAMLQFLEFPNRFSSAALWLLLAFKVLILVFIQSVVDALVL